MRGLRRRFCCRGLRERQRSFAPSKDRPEASVQVEVAHWIESLDFWTSVPVRDVFRRWLRRIARVCQGYVDRLVKLVDIDDLGPALLGDDEDARRAPDADAIAKSAIRFDLLRAVAAGIHD